MKVAVAGYGIEGAENYRYWQSHGDEVTILDEHEQLPDAPADARMQLGATAFDHLDEFDVVVRTAGLAPRKLAGARKVWSATNEFFARCPAPIIGVTGTKGKGTTCSLITSILQAAGKKVHLVGNIGQPALEVLADITPNDIVVYELSSFQLWDIERSPSIAVVLMIEADHLDVHENIEEYIAAKANIRRYQSPADSCVYHPTNKYAEQIAGTPLVRETVEEWRGKSSLSSADRYGIKEEDQVYVQDGFFCVQDRQICAIDNLQLPGAHNLENACAAISAVAELTQWPKEIRDEHVAEGLRHFGGLEHRLKFVREVGGVKFYDDSIATTPGSAMAAIKSFSEPVTIILGGHDKGGDLTDLLQLCHDARASVIAIGRSRPRIIELCAEYDVTCVEEPGDMTAIVQRAAAQTASGGVVVLSPAAASFDMFTSYKDRGEQFISAVNAL